MSQPDYFSIYIKILEDTFRRTKSILQKKHNPIKQLIAKIEDFLGKEVYGRIQPANYLLILLIILGTRAPKTYHPIIQTIQKLFSYNFISPNEDLSASIKLLKQDQFKDYLLLPFEDYSTKTFKEIYIQTIIALPDKDQNLNLNIVKNLSLIWRMGESSITNNLVGKIIDFIIDVIAIKSSDEPDEKSLRSALLQIVRHSVESYKESQEQKFLEDQNCISIKSVCEKYGSLLVDQVVIKDYVERKHGVKGYEVIPQECQRFDLIMTDEINQREYDAGKFGWCFVCRNTANYYCKSNRIPICSYSCKQLALNEFQSLDRFIAEEKRSAVVFQGHIVVLCKIFAKHFGHSDHRKRIIFAEIFIYIISEFKKINDRKMSPKIYSQLRNVFRKIIMNIYTESDAFIPSFVCAKKLLYLRIFVDEAEAMLKMLCKKMTHFLTPSNIRQQTLKFIKQLINSRFIFDLADQIDCNPERQDVVKELVQSLKIFYSGVPIPTGINLPPPQDIPNKKLALEVAQLFLKSTQDLDRIMSKDHVSHVQKKKQKMNLLKFNIERFNNSQKPTKVIKKLINEKFIIEDPKVIAQFLHHNFKKLSLVNIGALIGDHDKLACQIRDEYIQKINFKRAPIDEGLRILLKYFTIPGQSQVVERIIQSFGIAYFEQNKTDTVFVNSDAVYSFSYLLMMLQTNLHNPQVVQKMTLGQYSGLSKGMNGNKDAVFPDNFLESIYISVQRTPLGFHQKAKQMQLITAYNLNPKKSLQIHFKDLLKQCKESFPPINESGQIQHLYSVKHYPIQVFIEQFFGDLIDILITKVKESEDKEEIIKILDGVENVMKYSRDHGVTDVIQKAVSKLWNEIKQLSTIKKYLLMESLLEWIKKFSQHLYDQWKIVIYLFSKFYRSKLIKKQSNANKNTAIILINDKCYIYESFIEGLFTKSSKYNFDNLTSLIFALISISKQEIEEGQNRFCSQKISQVLEYNASRSVELFPVVWPKLRDFYTQIGRSKNENISLFAIDFLKQLITKFLKRKDLIPHQRDYFKPFEDLFTSSKLYAVREYIVGGMLYFVNNYHPHIKTGWKIILSIVSNCFEDDQHAVIKDKAFQIVKKIHQSQFKILNFEENYVDYVQILSRLSREKDEIYPRGCIQIVKGIIQYYHKLHNINIEEDVDSEANKSLDINFWQTVFLPLLSTIYGICGDFRPKVQNLAIQCLFEILMTYGKLFKYEFWKMVLQGVLRPTFEEITYTSQSRPLKKSQLDGWLKNSFTLLFDSINELICLYYNDFRLFLFDVFKIYQNCILNNSKILIQLSFNAMNELLSKIAQNFELVDWQVYLQFTESVLKKIIPSEITSLENWRKSKELIQNNYEGKCFALYCFLIKSQQVFEKYGNQHISEEIYESILEQLKKLYLFVLQFNEDIALRESIWKDGFYSEIKTLPGLVKHELQLLKFQSKILVRLRKINEKYNHQYLNFFVDCFIKTDNAGIKQQIKGEVTLKHTEQQRQYFNYNTLIVESLAPQLQKIGYQQVQKADFTDKIFQSALNLLKKRQICTKCQPCEGCQTNQKRIQTLNCTIKNIISNIFSFIRKK